MVRKSGHPTPSLEFEEGREELQRTVCIPHPSLHPLLRFGLRPCLQRPSHGPPLQPGSVCPSTCWTSPARPHQDPNSLAPETQPGQSNPVTSCPHIPSSLLCRRQCHQVASVLSQTRPPLTSLETPPGLPTPLLHHSPTAHNMPALPIPAGARPGPSAAPLRPLPPLPSSWSGLAALTLWHHTPLGSWGPPAWPLLLQLFSPPPPLHMVEGWRDGDREVRAGIPDR